MTGAPRQPDESPAARASKDTDGGAARARDADEAAARQAGKAGAGEGPPQGDRNAAPDAPNPDAAADADAAQDALENTADLIRQDRPARRRTPLQRLGRKAVRAGIWSRQTYARSVDNTLRFAHSREPALWLIALLVGSAVGGAAVLFRMAINAVQWLWLGISSERIIQAVTALPWWWVVAAPMAGGLVVGLLNQFVLSGRRPGGVADVIEASARGGAGLSARQGLWSSLATAVSLGSGASAGREGPVIHLGGTLAIALTRVMKLPPKAGRVVLACGVASAISASFNAPIAGVLFA
ncbi:MAG: chloride channel protein, partial [Pseudomonadota bacterium]